MRLSSTNLPVFSFIEGRLDFSSPVESVELYAGQLKDVRRIQPDFVITALGPGDIELSSVGLEPTGDFDGPVWSHVAFADVGPIEALTFFGMSNHVYWDELTVTVIPEPCSVSAEMRHSVS